MIHSLLLALLLTGGPDAGVTAAATDVSMLALITRPEQYEGSSVRLMAYVSIGFEESAIYFHQEDCDVGNTANALWLDLASGPIADRIAKTGLRKGWVVVEGTFSRSEKGHLAAFPAGLRSIVRLTPWKPRRADPR